MSSLITFSYDLLVRCIGHMRLHTSFKTNSHKCLAVGVLIGRRQKNLQRDKVKELWGLRSKVRVLLAHLHVILEKYSGSLSTSSINSVNIIEYFQNAQKT